jgi:hypothetical protein
MIDVIQRTGDHDLWISRSQQPDILQAAHLFAFFEFSVNVAIQGKNPSIFIKNAPTYPTLPLKPYDFHHDTS